MYYPITTELEVKHLYLNNKPFQAMSQFHTKGYYAQFVKLTPFIFKIVNEIVDLQDEKKKLSDKRKFLRKQRKHILATEHWYPDYSDEDIFIIDDKEHIKYIKNHYEGRGWRDFNKKNYPREYSSFENWKIHTSDIFVIDDKIVNLDFKIKQVQTIFNRHPEKYLRLILSTELAPIFASYDEYLNSLDLNDLSQYIDISKERLEVA